MNCMPMRAVREISYVFVPAVPTRTLAKYGSSAIDYVQVFYSNLHKWRSETYYISSTTELQAHPSFKAIIAIGEEAIPLILDDLTIRPSLLCLALFDITRETVVPDSDRGNIRAMTNAWISWGRRNGY